MRRRRRQTSRNGRAVPTTALIGLYPGKFGSYKTENSGNEMETNCYIISLKGYPKWITLKFENLDKSTTELENPKLKKNVNFSFFLF